jgi:enoyl-CoA hydratase/carnithine racemase
MDYREIVYEAADGIATITLDRPERLNAFTNRMRDELLDAIDRIDADDGVRAAIVTGRGRGFCAGADLGDGVDVFARTGPAEFDPVADADGGGMVTLRLFDARKPFIAAINGPAVGVGITMTLAMDVRLVADGAKIGFVFARRGLIPEACSSWFLPRVVGIGQALEWVATGRVFGAEEALRGGLVRSVHAPGELLGAARALAAEIADGTSAVSVAVSRQLLWRMLGAGHPRDAHALDSRGIFTLARDRDAAEGVAAFLEKRPPRFPLRVSQDLPDLWDQAGGR